MAIEPIFAECSVESVNEVMDKADEASGQYILLCTAKVPVVAVINAGRVAHERIENLVVVQSAVVMSSLQM